MPNASISNPVRRKFLRAVPAAAAAGTTATGESGRMFAASVVVGGPSVASSIARFIGAEAIEGTFATRGHRSAITVARIVAIVHVAIETVRSVEPGSDADK